MLWYSSPALSFLSSDFSMIAAVEFQLVFVDHGAKARAVRNLYGAVLVDEGLG